MNNNTFIEVNNVSLVYDLYYDKTNTLKEHFINLFKKREYLDKKKGKLYALDNVSLKIHNGERIGVIGLNGAGKSTFLKVLSGLLKPSSGSICVNGSVQPLIEIGAGFNPEFSGRENIYLNGAMLGYTKKEIADKEKEIISFCELNNFIDVPVKYYSSGMIVRLAFSIATIIKPEILLLDEMLSAGDLSFIAKAKKRMDDILNVAKILVLVSHDLGLIESLTMRSIVLDNGKVIFDGNTTEAIDFYKELVELKLVERAHDEELQRQKAILAQREDNIKQVEREREEESLNSLITINDIYHINCTRNTDEVMPDDEVSFYINFITKEIFNEFYINLMINDGTGGVLAHFRNDYSAIDLKNFNAGNHCIKINMQRTPFKSGKYKYWVRLVGKQSNGNLISKDYLEIPFVVLGEKKQSDMIKHNWVVE